MMKKLLSVLLLCVALTLSAKAQYENTKIQVGQKAPELAFKNPAGEVIKLSEINNKRIILLDFWASWCGPCRRANPKLVQLYTTYKDKKYKKIAKKGFEVVSVSLDQEKGPWVQAIEKDGLNWPYHMSDLGGWNAEPAKIYGVGFVPQAFLLGPDGTVWKKYMNAEEAVADLEQLSKGVRIYEEPKTAKN